MTFDEIKAQIDSLFTFVSQFLEILGSLNSTDLGHGNSPQSDYFEAGNDAVLISTRYNRLRMELTKNYPDLFPDLMVYAADDVRELETLARELSYIINVMNKSSNDWADIDTFWPFVHEPEINEETTSDFKPTEKENLRNSIGKFKLLVEETFHPDTRQSEFIAERLAYLANATDRLNRLDWRALAISTLIGIVINLNLDTERGRMWWQLVRQAFGSVTKLLQ